MWASILDRVWRDAPVSTPLITVAGETRTAAQQRAAMRRAVAWLHTQGLGAGDVLLLHAPRDLVTIDLHLGALAIGAATLPCHPAARRREVEHFIADAQPRVVVSPLDVPRSWRSDDVARALRDADEGTLDANVTDNAIALLLYTSGTTGAPKGAMITHANIAATVRALHQAWSWSSGDTILHTLPIAHVHGLIVAQHGAFFAGAHAVWADRFDASEVLRLIEKHKITVYMGVPTHYARLLEQRSTDANLASLRLMTSGSAPLSADVHRAINERFGVQIVERYGMTEIGIVLSNPLDGARKPGSIGVPLPGVRAQVIDADGREAPEGSVGELTISGPSVFSGYLGQPSKTAETVVDGWMRTGDLGYRDADGYYFLVGRRAEMIISGGYNVYPAEVERVFERAAGIREIAVVGLPDADLGERVVAAVIVDGQPDERAWRALAERELSPYKQPRAYVIVEDFPRTELGKVQRVRLATQLSIESLPANTPS